MSALVHEEILERLQATERDRRLVITPILDRKKQIGAGSVDLRLGTEFLETPRQSTSYLDPLAQPNAKIRTTPDRKTYVPLGDEFVLHPGQFVLGATLEFLVIPNDVVGQVLSRSSWGRVGLLVATAVAVQPGFRGALTLELVNAGSIPIVLRPGLRVAQLQLWESKTATENGYRASSEMKYDAPLGPQSNRLVTEGPERDILARITNELHPGRIEMREAEAEDLTSTTAS